MTMIAQSHCQTQYTHGKRLFFVQEPDFVFQCQDNLFENSFKIKVVKVNKRVLNGCQNCSYLNSLQNV